MSRRIFITATDTGAGKTYLTNQMIRQLLADGVKARAVKPVAAGTEESGLNEDVSRLMQAQVIDDPTEINLYSFAMPASPNLAAADESTAIDPARLVAWCDAQSDAELLLIEGVGGLMVPLTDTYLVCDWLGDLPDCEVIVVVGARLGCINHALLTLDRLARMGRAPLAVIINDLGDAAAAEQATQALRPHLDSATSLLRLPHAADLIHDHVKDILATLDLHAHST